MGLRSVSRGLAGGLSCRPEAEGPSAEAQTPTHTTEEAQGRNVGEFRHSSTFNQEGRKGRK